LATEINFLAFRGDQEYAHFAGLYKEAYDEVKRIAPGTKVFVSFQWDVARKLDEDQPAAMAEHAKHFELFRPGLDLLALTSYPSLLYESPAKLSEDYYAAVAKYVRKGEDVIYMELGWPGGGKGSDTQQAEYIRRLPGLMNGVNPSVMAWALLHDVNVFPADIGTSGLLTHEGGKRSGYEAWRTLKEGAPQRPRSSPKK
jgi:hypothetical protein